VPIDPKQKRKGSIARTVRVIHPRDEVRLGRKNWMAFGVALLVIVAGYIFLANGSITLAPLLLVAGYCVLIPYAILARDEKPGGGSDRRSGPAEGGA
jgi:hypothetical protein